MITIRVCIGSACHLKGSYNVIKELEKQVQEKNLTNEVNITGSFCLGHCTNAVSVQVDNDPVVSVAEDSVSEFLQTHVIPKL